MQRPRGGGSGTDGADDVGDLAGAEDRVNLGDLFLQLVAIALGEAAGDDEAAAGAVLLVLRHLENRVDRLLLRAVDEGAGVDDQDLRARRVVGQLVPRLLREPEHDFGIDQILRTTERNQTNLHYGYNL